MHIHSTIRHRDGGLIWVGLVTGSIGIAACSGSEPTLVADESLVGIEADAVVFDMEDYLTNDGIRSGVIRADTAHVFDDSSEVKMWGVDMTLFHEDGTERARVTSERGTLDRQSEEMTAYGNVVLVVDQGAQRVESSELHYDPDGDRIWSDSSSVFTREGRVTRGTCFRSDLSFRNYTVCNIRGAAGSIQRTPSVGGGP
jgi:LPS export ABC transporter protein LptC